MISASYTLWILGTDETRRDGGTPDLRKIASPLLLEQAVARAVNRNGPKGDNGTVAVALPADENARRLK